MQVEVVRSGLSYKSDILVKGQIVELENNMPKTPAQQYARWNNVFYVEVGGEFDNTRVKNILKEGEQNIFDQSMLITPSLNEDGQALMGDGANGRSDFETLVTEQPKPFVPQSQQEPPQGSEGTDGNEVGGDGDVEPPESDTVTDPDSNPEPDPDPVSQAKKAKSGKGKKGKK